MLEVFSPIYRKPIWQISLDGQNLANRVNPRFMSLSLTECRSDEADQLDLTLSDHDGLLEIPSRDAVIKLAIGWSDTGLVDKGTFTVDEVGYRGSPDVMTIRARSANLKGALRTRTERSFHGKTIKQIVEEIAQANELTAVVGQRFSNEKIPHIDQTNESDMAFLTRIGKRHDAVATVKEEKLLFMPIDGGKTASNEDLPTVQILRKDGDQHDFLIADRDTYTGVKAKWQDPAKQTKHTVQTGVTGNAKHLRTIYTNESDALAAVQAEWQRIQRGTATMRFSTAYGVPELSVQHKVEFPDFKKPISEITWLIKELTHSLSGSGLTTSLDLEKL